MAEDANMRMRQLGRGAMRNSIPMEEDFRDQPVYMPSGGKFEVYWTDDLQGSDVESVHITVTFYHLIYDAYVANP